MTADRDGRRARHESCHDSGPDLDTGVPGPGLHHREAGDPHPQQAADSEWKAVAWEHGDEPDAGPAVVRPYARTGGRTHPVRDLAVETLVVTSERGRDSGAIRSVEHLTIARLCEHTYSVAEVSALLGLPLGVARVLLADMADAGLVEILHNPGEESGAPDLPLMERVIAGLRNL